MFGHRKLEERMNARINELETRWIVRMDALEAQARRIEKELDRRVEEVLTRYEEHPDERVRFLLNSIAEELRTALAQALSDARQASEIRNSVVGKQNEIEELAKQLAARAQGEAGRQQRIAAKLNQVYRAPYTGYVSIFFTGGLTDRVSLMVGPKDPPEKYISELNCRNDINSYAGGVVRQGEFWMAQSEIGGRSGVECVYTPFL